MPKNYRFIGGKRKNSVGPGFGSIFRAETKDDEDDGDPFDVAVGPGKISGFREVSGIRYGRTMSFTNGKDGSGKGETKASLFAVTDRDGVDRKGRSLRQDLF